ncbi:MAG TPA: hypothetical protein VMW66_03490 [Elusimicrobiales bacterium]|nr:hypothetical protein [Elusimicrobiales bacterium]
MFKKITLFLFLTVTCMSSVFSKPVEVKYFYTPSCHFCLMFKMEVLPVLKDKYKGKVTWRELDVTKDEKAFSEIYTFNRTHGTDMAYPSVLIGDTLLTGVDGIRYGFNSAYKEALKTQKLSPSDIGESNIKEIYEKMSLLAILLSGLIDGVNPCAFAVIIFFISFLSVYGYNKREVIYVGSVYCIAVFLAYLLLGLGLFKALYAISGFYTVIKVFYWLVAGLCFAFFALSIYDFVKYKKTGTAEGLVLQLPKSFKLAINKIFGKYLRVKSGKSALTLIGASFVVGFFVSLIEAVCTGQIYVPVLAFILKEPQLRAKAFLYLVLYNVMFVMPLILVFALSLAGYKSAGFSNFFKKHLALIKVLLALVFLGLGLMLVLRT